MEGCRCAACREAQRTAIRLQRLRAKEDRAAVPAMWRCCERIYLTHATSWTGRCQVCGGSPGFLRDVRPSSTERNGRRPKGLTS
jgi:hypothetical protein